MERDAFKRAWVYVFALDFFFESVFGGITSTQIYKPHEYLAPPRKKSAQTRRVFVCNESHFSYTTNTMLLKAFIL